MRLVLVIIYAVFLSFSAISSFPSFPSVPFKKEIDSLSAVLKRNYSDKTQIEYYNKKSVSNRHQGNFQLSLIYGIKAEKLALKTNNIPGLIESYDQISGVYRELKN